MRRLLMILAMIGLCAAPSQAKDASASAAVPAPAATTADPPPKVRELLDLMGDPQVRAWLDQRKGNATAKADTASPDAAQSHGDSEGLGLIMRRTAQIRAHFSALIAAIPNMGDDFGLARDMVASAFAKQELLHMLRLLVLFVGLGYGLEWLFWRLSARFRARFDELKLDTIGQRLNVVGMRFAFAVGLVASFAAGSVGSFLALDWPPLLKEIVLGYLLAFLSVRLALAVGRFLLAPGKGRYKDFSRFRIIPMTTYAAKFWHRRIMLIASWIAFGWVTLDEFFLFGISEETRELLAYALGLVLLGLAIEAVWRRPLSLPPDTVEDTEQRHRRHARATLLSLFFALLWVLWVAGAMTLFCIVALAVGVPAAIRLTQRAVNHILRPPGHEEAIAGPASVAVVCLERGMRSLIVIGAIAWLGYVFEVDIGDLASRNTLLPRILRGALIAAIVVLIADFLWNIVKAVIDTRVHEAALPGENSIEEDRKRSRLRTLLPILRNMLFVVIVVIAGMMGLSSLGVEIGPLIASAGVVGVAIGFGAQTLVKDVISGIFYLLDDAFRVGEYIQSGNYRGVVESFSLRSVKLRHQNGPLFTVPFGVLGAVQNMSRDWAIEKLTIGVTYDTDIDKARKIVKKVGQELKADPELAAGIIEPLKMQGVQAFGDFAIQLRMKMMTRPGDVQFLARRRALALIKKAFDANGISFAYPTVQVAGGNAGGFGDTANAAVAQKGLELLKPAVGG
ncbi:Small-conductance mechanosensitive channel [Rhizobiales bacterium GAS113]|nr:Small-conductance mechanosensitive channel [Rhizobiales bacterium GAS113]SED11302.1 Small-conductance mechanosensitive channel [Rhizobiales bacterium GAS188]